VEHAYPKSISQYQRILGKPDIAPLNSALANQEKDKE